MTRTKVQRNKPLNGLFEKITLLSLLASCVLMAGGYKIPETSLNAVALSAANVAHSNGADAAYYNPANMVFMADENTMEMDLMYIGLDAPKYQGTYTSPVSGTSPAANINGEDENFFIPSFHYVSPIIGGARFGLSVVAPAGLSKRWDEAPAIYTAKEFSLTIIEVNPSIALPIGDKVGIAIGMRMVYTDGVVNSVSPISSREMTGDSIDFGYNLALSYKPSKELEFGLTYRSKIDLSVDGNADLSYTDVLGSFTPFTGQPTGTTYASSSSTNVSIPLPALLNVAVAYTFTTATTVEFVYERNFWSSYSALDFNYGSSTDFVTNIVFGSVIAKNWEDTNTFRFGITQELDKLRLMAGLVIDETPAPESTVGFELPDSDSISVSLGGRYQISDKINIGLAGLYSKRDDRIISNASLNGRFTNTDVLIISAGLEYRF